MMSAKLKTTLLYLTVFLNGAVVLVVEILGTRVIGPFFGSTIFVWSSLLAVALGFLSLGYWIGGLIADRKTKPTIFYSIVLAGGLLTTLVMKFDQPVLIFTEQFGIQFGPLVAAAILFSIPLTLFGMVSPFAIRLQTDELSEVGGTAGRIFAVATIGSLVGALASGFLLVPNFPISKIFIWSGITLAAVAVLGFVISTKSRRKEIAALLVFAAIGGAALYANPITWVETENTMRIVHTEPSFRADTKVIEVWKIRCLILDGTTQSCVYIAEDSPDEHAINYIQEVKRIVKENPEIKNVLVLGIGPGAMLEAFPNSMSVDGVDIDPKTFKLGEEFFGLEDKPNVNLVVADARTFLRNTDQKYDLIISDVFSANSYPPHLATKEYFELWEDHLSENGFGLFNLVGGRKGWDRHTTSLLKTLEEVFDVVVMTSPSTEGIGANLVHLTNNTNYSPSLTGDFSKLEISSESGLVLTDDYAPTEILAKYSYAEYRAQSKRLGGYRIFFVN